MKLTRFTFTVLTVCVAIVSGTKAAEAVTFEVIAEDLNNVRGINFGPDGNLYVGETGLGGDGNCQASPSTQGQLTCSGNTGSVTVISPGGEQSRIFDGFESVALQPSQYLAAGPQELSFDANGNAYLLTGYGRNSGNRDPELNALAANVEFPPLQDFLSPLVPAEQVLDTPYLGKLYKADLETGTLETVFDFVEYELLNNPDGGDIISNPYDFVIADNTAYVADGGGNAIYTVPLDGGEVEAIAVPTLTVNNPEFPPPSPDLPPGVVSETPPEQLELQSVPTGITVGPDGAVYFGEYTGFPYGEGKARIFRINEDGEPEVYADGFTHITDLTFDKDGNLLVLQFSDQAQWKGADQAKLPGSLIEIAPDGTQTTLVAAGEGLESGAGITVSPDGDIYVANRGLGTDGQVLKLDKAEAVPEPSSMLGLLAFGALSGGAWLKRKQKQ